MPETLTFSLIGKSDLKLGTGTFEVTLADGRVVSMDEINIGKLLEQWPIQTYATTALLPTTGVAAGSLARVSATETLYMYSGSSWSQVGGVGTHTHTISDLTSGTLTVAMGGTGQDFSAQAKGSVPYFSATGTISALSPGSVGAFLMGQGAAANPKFSAALDADGKLLIGDTGADPVAATITAGTGISVTNGAGSITIATTAAGINFVTRTSDSAARTSTTTLADDDTLLFAVTTSSTYFFELFLRCNSDSVSGDFKFGFSVPTGTTMEWDAMTLIGDSSVDGSFDHHIHSSWGLMNPADTLAAGVFVSETGSVSVGTLVGNHGVILKGWIFTAGTAGNVALQWAQASSNAANQILKAGSHFRYTKLI